MRGLIQLTGRANYQTFSDHMVDPDIMINPSKVEQLPYSCLVAGWFWWKNYLSELVDKGASVADVTRVVNGGQNGLLDREKYYNNLITNWPT